MGKRIGLILFCLGSFIFTMDANKKNKQPLNNEQIVIALDLHDVMFDFSLSKARAALTSFFGTNPWYNISLLNPLCGYRLYRVLTTTSVTGENMYDVMTQRYYPGLATSKDAFLKLWNVFVINPEMEKLVDELKQKGYRITVCSNIGKQACDVFCLQQKRFFDQCEVIVTSEPEDNYIRKPDPKFFEKFKKACHKKFGQEQLQFFFIDDKERNITAAHKAGINGCVFKNADQVRAYLKEQGLDLN